MTHGDERPRIAAVIPISGGDREFASGQRPELARRPLVSYTQHAVAESRYVDRTIVSTDSEHVAGLCRDAGLDVPFLRPAALANPEAPATRVVRHAVEWLGTQAAYLPEWIIVMFVTYPFRPPGLIDSFIETVLSRELDSAVAVVPERHAHWMLDDDHVPYLVTPGSETAKSSKQTVYRELSGLISMARRDVILGGSFYGKQLGMIPTEDVFAPVSIHDLNGWRLAEMLAPRYLEAAASQPARRP